MIGEDDCSLLWMMLFGNDDCFSQLNSSWKVTWVQRMSVTKLRMLKWMRDNGRSYRKKECFYHKLEVPLLKDGTRKVGMLSHVLWREMNC